MLVLVWSWIWKSGLDWCWLAGAVLALSSWLDWSGLVRSGQVLTGADRAGWLVWITVWTVPYRTVPSGPSVPSGAELLTDCTVRRRPYQTDSSGLVWIDWTGTGTGPSVPSVPYRPSGLTVRLELSVLVPVLVLDRPGLGWVPVWYRSGPDRQDWTGQAGLVWSRSGYPDRSGQVLTVWSRPVWLVWLGTGPD